MQTSKQTQGEQNSEELPRETQVMRLDGVMRAVADQRQIAKALSRRLAAF